MTNAVINISQNIYSKLVRIVSETDQDIKSFLEYVAVIDNHISHMGQFELKSFFAGGGFFFLMEMKNC